MWPALHIFNNNSTAKLLLLLKQFVTVKLCHAAQRACTEDSKSESLLLYVSKLTRCSVKANTRFYFCDNFGKCTTIITIFTVTTNKYSDIRSRCRPGNARFISVRHVSLPVDIRYFAS